MGVRTSTQPSTSNKDYCYYNYSTSSHLVQQSFPCDNYFNNNPSKATNNYQYSMSQDYHHHQANIFSFSNGFGRSQQEHLAQQIRKDKLRGGYDHLPPGEGMEEHQEDPSGGGLPVYETAGMLSEMFSFPPHPGTTTAGDFPDQSRQQHAVNHWYTYDQSSKSDPIHGSAAAMQLFLLNPHQNHPRSPSPAPSSSNNNNNTNNSSTLHMLLPNPSFNPGGVAHPFEGPPQFTSGIESQGLSLSLSSHLEAAKAEQFGLGGGGGDHGGGFMYGSSSGLGLGQHQHHQHHQALHLQGSLMGQSQPHHHLQIPHHHHVGFGNNSSSVSSSSIGVVNVLRSSKYVKPAQELLEEFCSVGRGHLKRNKLMGGKNNANPSSSTNNNNDNNGGNGNGSSSSTKEIPPLSAADRIEHQRRKVKLLTMLDEVDRRYNHYCEQMQMVVNSFDLVMGFGSAIPYTALAQKAMSRHFRCLKDAIAAQLKHSCELLGEKDASGSSGITKGETPRLKMLEQSLRQQRAFHQMGMMEQEAWRPQRGLPERSVNILRAWLFEHFLHPYPSDADKHLLSRQTGLSRNQVSNWFINARVRLWKPMVEEMYQQESKDEDSASEEMQTNSATNNNSGLSQTLPPTTTASSAAPPPTSAGSQLNANNENDPSLYAIQTRQRFADNRAVSSIPSANFAATPGITAIMDAVEPPFHDLPDDTCQRGSISSVDYAGNPTIGNLSHATADGIIRFGTNVGASGDVSLTLGLRHAGNMPEKGSAASTFAVRDFGEC